jgi:hypothetical protein
MGALSLLVALDYLELLAEKLRRFVESCVGSGPAAPHTLSVVPNRRSRRWCRREHSCLECLR